MERPVADEAVKALAARVRLIVLDVDGVLTDGGLYYEAEGLTMKRFAVLDGIGIRLAKSVGIEVAVISGMASACVAKRLEVLGITEYHGGFDNKVTVLEGIRSKMGLNWDEIAYVGDDWVDLAPMLRVGFPVAVANAMPDVKDVARYVTVQSGGHGAVRELVDLVLMAQGLRDELLEKWKRLE